jgi:hypothetical protein
LVVFQRRRWHHITPYSRCGPWRGLGLQRIFGEAESADNPARLSGGCHPVLTDLKPLGFVNTRTLSETVEVLFKGGITMKLTKIYELRELNYIELLPGRLSNGYLDKESIYIDDDSFSFIVAAIKRGFEKYKPFNYFEIEKKEWYKIINELANLKEIITIKDNSILKQYISIFFKDEDVCMWKLEEYGNINNSELISLIDELIKWVEFQLDNYDHITLIGL